MLQALTFLVRTLADLYLLTFLLRFIMQWSRANYYNPLSQLVFRVTNPLVVPARRVMPSVAGLDMPTLIVLMVLEIIVTFVLLRLAGCDELQGFFFSRPLVQADLLTLLAHGASHLLPSLCSRAG